MLGLTEWVKDKSKMEPQKKELSSFAHIEGAVMERMKEDHAPRETEQAEARKAANEFIAGFPIQNPDKEKAALDALISKRNASITNFLSDRKAVTENLGKLGVQPLAIVPTKAWADICHKAGMVVMQPNDRGQVTVSYDGIRRYGSGQGLAYAMSHDHTSVVRALFPRTVQSGVRASVILPTPPADVAETLLKVRSLSLHVAAVPEAVKFVQTAEELYKATEHPKDELARRQGYADYKDWVRRDPIVFTNHGSASAIIAQFGDFPIEKEVVDLVIAADDLLPKTLQQATTQADGYAATTVDNSYQLQLDRLQVQRIADAMWLADSGNLSAFTGASGIGFAGVGGS